MISEPMRQANPRGPHGPGFSLVGGNVGGILLESPLLLFNCLTLIASQIRFHSASEHSSVLPSRWHDLLLATFVAQHQKASVTDPLFRVVAVGCTQ
jgi:hypothetical protein